MRDASIANRGAQHFLARLVDNSETYGATVVRAFLRRAAPFNEVADIGAGHGRDLALAAGVCRSARLHAIDYLPRPTIASITNNIHRLNVEVDKLPFSDESLDLILANQVLEHLKEIFWVFHEISRALCVGGHAIIGVPNVLSLHNRLLTLVGRHPTQHKLASAHVRVFSDADFRLFLNLCWPSGLAVSAFAGSQFYPFPAPVARVLSRMWPNAAFSVFWLLKKQRPYNGEFLAYLARAELETNFWRGSHSD